MTFPRNARPAPLVSNAPLDRHGINFAQAFNEIALRETGSTDIGTHDEPDASFGKPGVNFNNHIPSNCQNCHGGLYNGNSVSGVFLPWDLDQFEFDNSNPQNTRDVQQDAFFNLNQLARSVAVSENRAPIIAQIDGWYAKGTTFDSTYVPPGWSGPGNEPAVYFDVVRRSCRGCHVALPSGPFFDSSADFLLQADDGTKLAGDLTTHLMPHALQTQREFWLSSQPLELETWLRAQGTPGPTAVANVLSTHSGPGTIVTLDPPGIAAATGF